MTLTELLFQCPDPDCERGFDAEFKLNQHMDDTGHCECETLEEDWDDEVPSPDVRQVPPRQASKRTIRLAGEALAHPDQCGTECKQALAGAHLAVGRVCSGGCGNRSKVDCPNDSCGACCQGCAVH